MRLLQKIVVLLNFAPCTALFAAIYRFGLRRLVTTLARHPAVYAIFGYGSFFEGDCLYGVSDIDVVVLIDKRYTRNDTVHNEIALTYNRLRRWFPFLAPWHESAENLVFLADCHAGFAVPESIRLRAKQGRLTWLSGNPFPPEFIAGAVSLSEVIAEVDTLLRIALMKGEQYTSNLLFWKRLFGKLIALADSLGLQHLALDMQQQASLDFLHTHNILLYIHKSDTNALFRLLLTCAQRLFEALRERETSHTLHLTRFTGSQPQPTRSQEQPGPSDLSPAMAAMRQAVNVQGRPVALALCGLTPRLHCFQLDMPVWVFDLQGGDYTTLRLMAGRLEQHGTELESCLVQMHDFLFVMRRLASHVDIIPLDPCLYANVYTRVSHDKDSFTMPAQVYHEQRTLAERMFAALASIYRDNEGHIPKLPFPCIYLEDDLVVIRDALHRLRVLLAHTDGVDIASAAALIDFLRAKYPTCEGFFRDLLAYYRHLCGLPAPQMPASNLYRSLLQGMAQLLSGARQLSLDDHRKRLGITVGIITRNRATDLQDVLASLTRQLRPPDEVLIVDNGSTDPTRAVVERFRDRLPVSYHFLPQASIPRARNAVLEQAQHDIVSFTDDDCIVEPGWLQAVERGFLRADNVGMVGGWVWHEPAEQASMLDTYYSLYHHNKT